MARVASVVGVIGALGICACKSAPSCPVQPLTDPVATLEIYDGARRGWQSLKAEARVTQWADRGRIRGTVLLFLQRPDRVRFDVMTALGPAAVLTSDGESFQLSDLREGTFLYGPTCRENIARLLGVSVAADEVVLLLTGSTPPLGAAPETMECRDGMYVIETMSPDGARQEVVLAIDESDLDKPPEAQRLTLRRSTRRDANGAKQWEATYEDYTTVDGYLFPTRVRFVDEVNDADTEVRVRSITLDPKVPEDAFRQTPAPGMSTELAPCT